MIQVYVKPKKKRMNRERSNEIQMMKVVKAVLVTFATLVAGIPALAALAAAFGDILDGIDAATLKAEAIKIGMRKKKKMNKLNLASIASKVANAIFAYGNDSSNPEMAYEANYPEYKLKKMKDIKLVNICKDILLIGQANKTALLDYGISPADLTNLDATITVFDAIIPASQQEIDDHKDLMETINALVKEGLSLMKLKMDRVVKVAADANPDFSSHYFKARAIDDFVGKRRKVKPITGTGILLGTVTNSVDGSVIEEATVMIVELNLVVTTDEDGAYYFESVPVGKYTVRVTAATYLENTVKNVDITKDSEVTLDFALDADLTAPVVPLGS